MNPRRIATVRRPPDLCFRAAPSKSATHRALIAAALAEGRSTILSPLFSEDTRVTLEGLRGLGFNVVLAPDRVHLDGRGGAVPGGGRLSLADSGTSFRFLLALSSLGARPTNMDGSPRLRQRPARELARALERLGAGVALSDAPSGLPLVTGGRGVNGGAAAVPSGRSSQFASALLLIGAALPLGLDLTLVPPVVSLPYVELTLEVLARFGITVGRPGPLRFRVGRTTGKACELSIDGDHSSASYFLAAAAITGGRVRVTGLDPGSAQPDARLVRILAGVGCETRQGTDWVEVRGTGEIEAFSVDVGDAPDLVPTLAVLALFAEGPSALTGIAHLRHKESDRLKVLERNLRALGRDAEALADGLAIGRMRERPAGAPIVSASDHRIAMAFAVAGLRLEGLSIDDPGCVDKSNPGFWSEFRRLEDC